MRKILTILAAAAAVAAVLLVAVAPRQATSQADASLVAASHRAVPAAAAAFDHTVTFVNHTGRKVWIGSEADQASPSHPHSGSRKLTGLPVLNPGQSATIKIPETAAPGHWSGTFFARMGCSGKAGSTFHCKLGDCGKYPHKCAQGQQPVSLAEFAFPRKKAPSYDVSYVDAFSVPITITPVKVTGSGGGCTTQGCAQNLLPECPRADLTRWADGKPKLCTDPNKNARTPYSHMIATHCPRAYGRAKADRVPGNHVVGTCSRCKGFIVEFHKGA